VDVEGVGSDKSEYGDSSFIVNYMADARFSKDDKGHFLDIHSYSIAKTESMDMCLGFYCEGIRNSMRCKNPETKESVWTYTGYFDFDTILERWKHHRMEGRQLLAKGRDLEMRVVHSRGINGAFCKHTGWTTDPTVDQSYIGEVTSLAPIGKYDDERKVIRNRPDFPPSGWSHNPIDELYVFWFRILEHKKIIMPSRIRVQRDSEVSWYAKYSGVWLREGR
jgi:hypothetical protein